MIPQLFLFHTDARVIAAVACDDAPIDGRVDGVVVDWERSGKYERQRLAESLIGSDTQISIDTVDDLQRVHEAAAVPVICRLDAWRHGGSRQLDVAIQHGADEVLLPMVRSVGEVEEALDRADDRIGVGVMLETSEAVLDAASIARLGITRAYVGLMDLGIERRQGIFSALVDGTVEQARAACESVPFGFGGLTGPGFGDPVPSRLLAAEMARLGCEFTFLRRSFLRDHGHSPAAGVAAIRVMLEELASRPVDEVLRDRAQLRDAVLEGVR